MNGFDSDSWIESTSDCLGDRPKHAFVGWVGLGRPKACWVWFGWVGQSKACWVGLCHPKHVGLSWVGMGWVTQACEILLALRVWLHHARGGSRAAGLGPPDRRKNKSYSKFCDTGAFASLFTSLTALFQAKIGPPGVSPLTKSWINLCVRVLLVAEKDASAPSMLRRVLFAHSEC